MRVLSNYELLQGKYVEMWAVLKHFVITIAVVFLVIMEKTGKLFTTFGIGGSE